MQNHDWIELFRLIPAERQNTLVLTTLSGVDLNVEVILRTEQTYLVFRGRVSGITEDGRVFFLPYRQIDYLQINRIVSEAEVRQLYGEAGDGSVDGAPDASLTDAQGEAAIAAEPPNGADLSSTPASPTAPAPAVPSREPVPGLAARLSTAPGVPAGPLPNRLSNVPAAALQPQPPQAGRPPNGTAGEANGDGPTPPRNSILERLRAQRNSMAPPRPPGR